MWSGTHNEAHRRDTPVIRDFTSPDVEADVIAAGSGHGECN